jgi:hypothetical protein
MEHPPLPVPDETLLEHLHRSHELLLDLRAAEQTPKVQESIRLLELARSRMYEALRSMR